jgi:hypothetical protein
MANFPWLMEIYGRTEIKDGSQAQPKFLAVSIPGKLIVEVGCEK